MGLARIPDKKSCWSRARGNTGECMYIVHVHCANIVRHNCDTCRRLALGLSSAFSETTEHRKAHELWIFANAWIWPDNCVQLPSSWITYRRRNDWRGESRTFLSLFPQTNFQIAAAKLMMMTKSIYWLLLRPSYIFRASTIRNGGRSDPPVVYWMYAEGTELCWTCVCEQFDRCTNINVRCPNKRRRNRTNSSIKLSDEQLPYVESTPIALIWYFVRFSEIGMQMMHSDSRDSKHSAIPNLPSN